MKIYTKDTREYRGEVYDTLNTKLRYFYDCCSKLGVQESQYHLAFSVMLKGRAAKFYFDKVTGRNYSFQKMVQMMQQHFETEENRQRYLTEWRETTFLRIIKKNPDKTRMECLEILFDFLCTI